MITILKVVIKERNYDHHHLQGSWINIKKQGSPKQEFNAAELTT